MNELDSLRYRESIEYGLQHGLNFIDTAINYRDIIQTKGILSRIVGMKQVEHIKENIRVLREGIDFSNTEEV